MEQLELSNLCKDKIQDTNVKNLGSLMSQIENYIPKCECDEIRARGHAKAELDFQSLDVGQRQGLDKVNWSRKEKWVLLWATEYSKLKVAMNQREKCAEWQSIFYHHCPDKIDIPKSRLPTQKLNIIRQKFFSPEALEF